MAAVGLSNSIAQLCFGGSRCRGNGSAGLWPQRLGRIVALRSHRPSADGRIRPAYGVADGCFFATPFAPSGRGAKLAGTADPYFRLYAISIAPMILSAVTGRGLPLDQCATNSLSNYYRRGGAQDRIEIGAGPWSGTNPLLGGSRGGLGYQGAWRDAYEAPRFARFKGANRDGSPTASARCKAADLESDKDVCGISPRALA
jgi:hypothetical protein